jgi:hypothetical protein
MVHLVANLPFINTFRLPARQPADTNILSHHGVYLVMLS